MGLTPTLQLPYPEASDPADVPVDMRELAERVEAVFGGRVRLLFARSNAGVAVTVPGVDIPGASITTTVAKASVALIWGAFDFETPAGVTASGYVVVDAALQPAQAIQGASNRGVVSQMAVVAASAASHTWKLSATATATGANCWSPHSQIVVVLFEGAAIG